MSLAFDVRQFLRLSIANIVSNLLVPLAGLIDVAFLGHLADIRQLAGVSLATVIFNYLYWTFGFLRMGTTGMVAQALGQSRRDEAILVAFRNGAIALIVGVVMVLLQEPIAQLGFFLLSATPEVKAAGYAFFKAMISGAPATLLNFVLLGWFLGNAQSRNVLMLSTIANGAAVALDYWLVVRLGWQSAGAGWATALSQYVMVTIAIALFLKDVPFSQLKRLSSQLFNFDALESAFVLNREITIRTFALISTFAVFTNLSSAFGTQVLTANTLLMQVVTFTAYFIDGIAFATETWAGILWGQHNAAGLTRLLVLAGGASLAIGLFSAIAFMIAPALLLRLLTSHTDVIAQASSQVGWLLPILSAGAIAYMLDGYFLGLTAGKTLRQSVLIATIGGFAPMAIVAQLTQNPSYLWAALTMFMLLRAATLSRQVSKTLVTASTSVALPNPIDRVQD